MVNKYSFPFSFQLTVPAAMDVDEDDYSTSDSFVTSAEDPTTGYFLPPHKHYIYRVTCQDAENCNFEKMVTGYKNPVAPVTMAVPGSGAFTCP